MQGRCCLLIIYVCLCTEAEHAGPVLFVKYLFVCVQRQNMQGRCCLLNICLFVYRGRTCRAGVVC